MQKLANGVMYVCMWDDEGSMFALDAENGDILWSYQNGGTCNSGAAVVDGRVYWGSGYQSFGTGTGSEYFRAFGIPEDD